MNETKYALFEPYIIRTADFLPNLEPGDPELFDPTRPDFVPPRGERCLQITKQITSNHNHSKVCLLDGHPFEGHSYCLPVSYDSEMDQFSVLFSFCSLSCVKRYAMSTRLFRPDIIMPLIALMSLKVYNVESVIPAPPRELLFMGELTVEQFRACTSNHDLMVDLKEGQFQMSHLHMMTLDASSIISTKSKEAKIEKIPKKLFEQSPFTKKRILKKQRLEQEELMKNMESLELEKEEEENFIDLPEQSFAPQPQCIDHPQVPRTLLDVINKKQP